MNCANAERINCSKEFCKMFDCFLKNMSRPASGFKAPVFPLLMMMLKMRSRSQRRGSVRYLSVNSKRDAKFGRDVVRPVKIIKYLHILTVQK